MAVTFGKLEGQIVVPSGGWSALCGDTGGSFTATVPAGNYYHSSADSGANDLAAELVSQINASNAGGGGTWTVTIAATENGTGKVTIACDQTCTVTWTSTDLRDVLGFTGNLSAATSYTSTYQARSLWLPNCGKRTPYGDSDAGVEITNTRSVVAPDGTAFVIAGGQTRIENWLEWPGLTSNKCRIAAESTVNESFQKFLRDALLGQATWAVAGRVRFYPDAATDATYTTYTVTDNQLLMRFEPALLRDSFIGVQSVRIGSLTKVP